MKNDVVIFITLVMTASLRAQGDIESRRQPRPSVTNPSRPNPKLQQREISLELLRHVQKTPGESPGVRAVAEAEREAKAREAIIRLGHRVHGSIYPFAAVQNLGCVWSEKDRCWFAPSPKIQVQAYDLMSRADGSRRSEKTSEVVSVRQLPDGTRITNVFRARQAAEPFEIRSNPKPPKH